MKDVHEVSMLWLAVCLIAGCGSDPNAPETSAGDVDVYFGLSIDGHPYPSAFTETDTVLYHTFVLDASGTVRSWCGVSRGGARSVECPYSGTWEEVSDMALRLIGSMWGTPRDVAVHADTLRWLGDGGPEVHVRCLFSEVGRIPCETEPPGDTMTGRIMATDRRAVP